MRLYIRKEENGMTDRIKKTLGHINKEAFARAVDALISSKKIYYLSFNEVIF